MPLEAEVKYNPKTGNIDKIVTTGLKERIVRLTNLPDWLVAFVEYESQQELQEIRLALAREGYKIVRVTTPKEAQPLTPRIYFEV